MKTIQAEQGYYFRNGDDFCKKIIAPDNVDLSDWKLVTEEEYNKVMPIIEDMRKNEPKPIITE